MPGPTWTPPPAPVGRRAWPSAATLHLPCRVCGGGPALDVTFHQNTGLVVRRTTTTFSGPFCRRCGIAVFRDAQSHTAVKGWWGVTSFFVTIGYLIGNTVDRVRMGRVAPTTLPRPSRARVPLGRTVFLRGGGLAIAALVVVVGALLVVPDSPEPLHRDLVGRCVTLTGAGRQQRLTGFVPCSGTHQGKVLDAVDDPTACPIGTDAIFGDGRGHEYLCVTDS